MSTILDNSDVDIELTTVEHAEDSFIILNADVDETSQPPDESAPASEDLQSESSDSSFLDIDEIDDEEIDTTENVEHQVSQELEEVSTYMTWVIRKLHYKILSLG